MRSTPVAGRPADAAAGDAPVTRHAVERREVIVVPAISGAPLQASSGEGVSASSNPVPNLLKPTGAVESSQHPSGETADSFGPGGVVLMEVAQAVKPTTKSHAPVVEHDESLVPATHCWPSPGSPEYTVGCPGCDGRSCRHLVKFQQKRIELGLSASSSLRDVVGDVVVSEVPTSIEEVPPPSPPAEPPPVLKTSAETDAMILAAAHPYGHEEPLEISRTEFESIVRDGFYIEEDTLEELPLDEVVEGVNRELDLMKSCPV